MYIPDIGKAEPGAEVLDEEQPRRRERRVERDVEPAVAVQQARGGALRPLAADNEHGHHRAVLARVSDLRVSMLFAVPSCHKKRLLSRCCCCCCCCCCC